jgi:hypothetical protein
MLASCVDSPSPTARFSSDQLATVPAASTASSAVLQTPEVSGLVDQAGLPLIVWTPVPGALFYQVKGVGDRLLFDETVTVTSWQPDSTDLDQFLTVDGGNPQAFQDNVGEGWRGDDPAIRRALQITVTAHGAGSLTSAPGSFDVAELASRLPYRLAEVANTYLLRPSAAVFDVKNQPLVFDPAKLPDRLAVSMADGQTVLRHRLVVLAETVGVQRKVSGPAGSQRVDCVRLVLQTLAANLRERVYLCGSAVQGGRLSKTAKRQLRQQNRQAKAAVQEQENYGDELVEYAGGPPVLADAQLATTQPTVDLPSFAFSRLGRFVEANLLAGATCMQPPPTVWDVTPAEALVEVGYQNPYMLGATLYVSDQSAVAFCVGGWSQDQTAAAASRAQLARLVERAVSQTLTPQMSETEQVRALNDYLTEHLSYDKAAYDPNRSVLENLITAADHSASFTALGALASKKAVCLGYAQAFQALAKAAGLQSVVVTGQAGGEAHAWNKVHLKDHWRVVDTTWNDPGTAGVANQYLLLTDKQLSRKRRGEQDSSGYLPAALLDQVVAE